MEITAVGLECDQNSGELNDNQRALLRNGMWGNRKEGIVGG